MKEKKKVKLPVLEVDEDIKEKLQKEAEREGVPMSTIRKRAYKSYLN